MNQVTNATKTPEQIKADREDVLHRIGVAKDLASITISVAIATLIGSMIYKVITTKDQVKNDETAPARS